MFYKTNKNFTGFTLIELLIVITLIGILSGIATVVINPTLLQRRSNDAVLRTTTDKVCLALNACVSSRQRPLAQCTTFAQLGIADPAGTPEGSTFDLVVQGNDITVTGSRQACSFVCGYNVATGLSTQATVSTENGVECAVN